MKTRILLLFVCIFYNTSTFGQDNPYEIFGYKPKTILVDEPEHMQVQNKDTTSNIKFFVFNIERGFIELFDKNQTLIRQIKIENNDILRFISPDPLAFKYFSISPYNYVNNNPLRFIDPDGREIIGVNKKDAQQAQKEFSSLFQGERFDSFRGLISLDKSGKKFAKIDENTLSEILKSSNLSEDDRALISTLSSTINSSDKHMVEYANKQDLLSSTGQSLFSENLPKQL